MSTPDPMPLPATQIAACTDRLNRLRLRLASDELDGLLITNDVDIRYLTGFVGHDSVLLVTAGEASIVSDPRYDEFLDPWRSMPLAKVVMGVRHRLEQSIKELCIDGDIKRLGIQAEYCTVAARSKLAARLDGIEIADSSGIVAALRMRKDELEIAAIEKAVDIQQQALAAALPQLREGMTETQFCAVLEYEMKMRGSFSPSFDIMVSTGANSSIIHHMTGSSVIQHDTLLLDWGARVDGYSSDMTRTFGFGTMPVKVQEIYEIVLEAQLAAIDACAPGKVCAEVDEVARKLITDAGYGEQFGHGLGHGLGMDTHESPYFNDLQTDIVLEPGMVMTVEPGIYLPGVGGVRIEDDVLITENGARVLSQWPKDLHSMMLEPTATSAPAAQGIDS